MGRLWISGRQSISTSWSSLVEDSIRESPRARKNLTGMMDLGNVNFSLIQEPFT